MTTKMIIEIEIKSRGDIFESLDVGIIEFSEETKTNLGKCSSYEEGKNVMVRLEIESLEKFLPFTTKTLMKGVAKFLECVNTQLKRVEVKEVKK
ncbi:MAG: hypothetical protein IKC11_02865 [Clostridia bacterium]|nr:hypothetical protein [Clostridia bacterium]